MTAARNGDCYTTVVGNDTNTGASADQPKLTLTNLLATYTLQTGDVVYVDTGTYTGYTVVVTSSGSAANPILSVAALISLREEHCWIARIAVPT